GGYWPVTVTGVPTVAAVGLRCVRRGTRRVNGWALAPVPEGFVTVTSPVVAPAGTVVVIWPSFTTVKVAAVPLNLTPVVPVKNWPVIVTGVPTVPAVGLSWVTLGPRIVNVWALVPVPLGFVTVTKPVVAKTGTVVVICVSSITVKLAVVPLNLTLVVPVKFWPVIVTGFPTVPAVGLSCVMSGPGTVNTWSLVASPTE